MAHVSLRLDRGAAVACVHLFPLLEHLHKLWLRAFELLHAVERAVVERVKVTGAEGQLLLNGLDHALVDVIHHLHAVDSVSAQHGAGGLHHPPAAVRGTHARLAEVGAARDGLQLHQLALAPPHFALLALVALAYQRHCKVGLPLDDKVHAIRRVQVEHIALDKLVLSEELRDLACVTIRHVGELLQRPQRLHLPQQVLLLALFHVSVKVFAPNYQHRGVGEARHRGAARRVVQKPQLAERVRVGQLGDGMLLGAELAPRALLAWRICRQLRGAHARVARRAPRTARWAILAGRKLPGHRLHGRIHLRGPPPAGELGHACTCLAHHQRLLGGATEPLTPRHRCGPIRRPSCLLRALFALGDLMHR
mmetsp:Transcript_7201/g.21742  ORF Transcript_7201/g.21742 Transcript_7201/m.21742 type:complete len:365 (-) Transcript_7201:1174-2268(-)